MYFLCSSYARSCTQSLPNSRGAIRNRKGTHVPTNCQHPVKCELERFCTFYTARSSSRKAIFIPFIINQSCPPARCGMLLRETHRVGILCIPCITESNATAFSRETRILKHCSHKICITICIITYLLMIIHLNSLFIFLFHITSYTRLLKMALFSCSCSLPKITHSKVMFLGLTWVRRASHQK